MCHQDSSALSLITPPDLHFPQLPFSTEQASFLIHASCPHHGLPPPHRDLISLLLAFPGDVALRHAFCKAADVILKCEVVFFELVVVGADHFDGFGDFHEGGLGEAGFSVGEGVLVVGGLGGNDGKVVEQRWSEESFGKQRP